MSGHLIGCVKNLKASSFEITNPDGSTRLVRIGKSHKLGMVAFADSADDQTHIGFPGYKGVMEWAACSRSRAAEIITDLVDVGLLRSHRTARPGKNAEYVVFPRGCCETHRLPAPDERDPSGPSLIELVEQLEAAGIPLTDDQRRLLDAPHQNGSEIPDPSRGDESEIPDPSNDVTDNGSEISDSSAQRVQNESEISEYSTTPISPPSPRKRGPICSRHQDTPGDCCRACGTTPRQLERARQRHLAGQRRLADQAAAAADRARAAAAVPLPADLKATAREQIRAASRRSA